MTEIWTLWRSNKERNLELNIAKKKRELTHGSDTRMCAKCKERTKT